MTKTNREALIDDIIALELEMFLAVRSRERSLCQERPEAFRLMREITHAVLSDEFLEAYLRDVRLAAGQGRNLMTEKYALMEDLIPAENDDPAVWEIVKAESDWRREVAAQFPRSVHPDGHEGFCLYLECELQTYSAQTLAAYSKCIEAARAQSRNLVRERYELLMRKLGHESLAACEVSIKTR